MLRCTMQARLFVVADNHHWEWTGGSGEVGRLIDWFVHDDVAVAVIVVVIVCSLGLAAGHDGLMATCTAAGSALTVVELLPPVWRLFFASPTSRPWLPRGASSASASSWPKRPVPSSPSSVLQSGAHSMDDRLDNHSINIIDEGR